jgi:hypothetical protein
MGTVIVVFILDNFFSALLRLESKLIVVACRDASVIRGIFRVRTLQTATISLDSSFKRAERKLSKMKTTITFPICNLFHLWSTVQSSILLRYD